MRSHFPGARLSATVAVMKRNSVATAIGSTIVVASLVLGSLALTGCPDNKGGATPTASGSGASSAAPPTSKAGGSSGSGW